MQNLNCYFNNPVEIGSTSFKTTAFSGMNCSTTEMVQLQAGDQTFYIKNTWDLGELFIAFLLVVSLLLGIFKWIFEFFFNKVIKIERKQ